jgi:twitching motility two-component system response regulator PilH
MTRILIVDDSPTDVHVLKTMLEQSGYGTLMATSGEQGLEVAGKEKPNLILMDVVMPGMNGFQATRRLSRNPVTASIPVIIVTTKDQETDKVWGLRQGAKDYVVKPPNRADLIAKIESLLGG